MTTSDGTSGVIVSFSHLAPDKPPKPLTKQEPIYVAHSPDTMNRSDYQSCYDFIQICFKNGFYVVRGFDVFHWYKGLHGSFFSAYHHMATTRPMLRLFAPKV